MANEASGGEFSAFAHDEGTAWAMLGKALVEAGALTYKRHGDLHRVALTRQPPQPATERSRRYDGVDVGRYRGVDDEPPQLPANPVDDALVEKLGSLVDALQNSGWVKIHCGALVFLEPALAALKAAQEKRK